MSSRVILKNLPPYLNQAQFATHFASSPSAPTDAKLQLSKSGKSRRFGFLGFVTREEAEKAAEYWDKTFIGTTKINAELARSVEEEALVDNYKKKRIEDALEISIKAKYENAQKQREFNQAQEDPKLAEFLKVNQKRVGQKSWANDEDREFVQVRPTIVDDIKNLEEDDEYEPLPAQVKSNKSNQAPHEPEYEVIEIESQINPTIPVSLPSADSDSPGLPSVTPLDPVSIQDNDKELDDADWLRNKTSRLLDLTDDDSTLYQAPASVNPYAAHSNSVAAADDTSTGETVPAETATMTDQQPETNSNQTIGISHEDQKVREQEAAIEKILETSRLFLRNLAYTVDQTALAELFSAYGELEDVHVPPPPANTTSKDGRMSKPRGTAFILFRNASDAVSAFEALDGKSFQGRLLHILPASPQLVVSKPDATLKNVSAKRKEERRKEAAKVRFNWNSLFLNQDTVLEVTAKKFGVTKSELLDPTSSSAGITMALAESSLLGSIKSYFKSQGVDLSTFKDMKQKDDSIILFKNLSTSITSDELEKLIQTTGQGIRRIAMPESGGLAIVEFDTPEEGKIAFSRLAYRKIGDSGVLYLEKGPVGCFSTAAPLREVANTTTSVSTSVTDGEEHEEQREEEQSNAAVATIFVKNLNFDTRAPGLAKLFEFLRGFRNATVKTKSNPKNPTSVADRLSMGFGFVEFASEADATLAIKTMQGFKLDNHALDLKISNGRTPQTIKSTNKGSGSAKVIVKNLPFETTKKDIQTLFSAHGSLKSLRLPKKHNSHLRGFAFLEFLSKREAANAISALEGTHILGRRMVLEYADEEGEGDIQIDNLVEKTARKRAAEETVEGGRRKIGKVNLDGETEDY